MRFNKKIIVILMCLISIIVLCSFYFYKNRVFNNNNNQKSNVISYDNYIYKIRYDFGTEGYIYLLENNIIKYVTVEEIYEVEKGCNCLKPSGEYSYKEEIINFSLDSMKKILVVFDELYNKVNKKEFNIEDVELNNYQERILLSISLNNENMITIEDNIKINIEEKKLSNNNFSIVNKRSVLDANSNNEIVNKIAIYLNDLVSKDFEVLNNNSEDMITNIEENLGVDLKINFIYAGPFSLSFTYTKEGQLGATSIHDIKGYSFKYNGDINVFDANGWKDKYHKRAIEEFKKSEIYLDYNESLYKDWETIIFDNMFLTGNWYLEDNKIIFLIPSHLLGLESASSKIIILKTDLDENF